MVKYSVMEFFDVKDFQVFKPIKECASYLYVKVPQFNQYVTCLSIKKKNGTSYHTQEDCVLKRNCYNLTLKRYDFFEDDEEVKVDYMADKEE